MRLFKRRANSDYIQEEKLEDVKFNIHKFNNRPRPDDPKKIMVVSTFAEFGCETVGVLYSLPMLLQRHAGMYSIVMGWHGREFFYRNLVDEFWEIKPEHMWMRELCRAFHHDSKNLLKIEESVKNQYGLAVDSCALGIPVVTSHCYGCGRDWAEQVYVESCPDCKSTMIRRSLFSDIQNAKHKARPLPQPSDEKMKLAASLIEKPAVGVFARGRKAYGRNLQPEFYVKLIGLLREMGYSPVWLGEAATTQKCPVEDVVDLAHSDYSKDLELTFAIVKQLEFTVQFWTASTRIAGMTGTPYLLFESPDQIWGGGQEGYRRNLCDQGPSKLSVNHFLNVYNDNDAGIEVVRHCIEEMVGNNYKTHIGLVDQQDVVQKMIADNKERIGS